MRVSLSVHSAGEENQRIELLPGSGVTVGSSPEAGLAIRGDEAVSPIHFEVRCSDDDCRVRSMVAGATAVNGLYKDEASLADGDQICAGSTLLTVRYEEARLLSFLRRQPAPLFAILDAARDKAVLDLLQKIGGNYRSLYEGAKGEALASAAPYLVELPAASPLLPHLVSGGWGKSWGVYLTSPLPFDEVRRHLRRFLLVQMEDGGRRYFRYYDPRVLRVFLPTCEAQEYTRFFEGMRAYLMEDEDPATLLRFSIGPSGFDRENIHVIV